MARVYVGIMMMHYLSIMVYFNDIEPSGSGSSPAEQEYTMNIKVNGIKIGTITTNRSLTIEEAMDALGYDITDEADCKSGYDNGIEGFYLDDDGNY